MRELRFLGLLLAALVGEACFTVKGSYERPQPQEPVNVVTRDAATESPDSASADDATADLLGSGARAAPACHPRSLRGVAVSNFQEAHTPPPMCAIDETGVVSMSYATFPECPVFQDPGGPSGDYRACYFGQNEDVSAFERGRGLFEARYCFDGPLYENLNVWFDTQSEPSTPLRLMRLLRGDDPTVHDCRTMLLSLEDSCISAFDRPNCGIPCSDEGPADGGPVEAGAGADGRAGGDASPDGGSDGGEGGSTIAPPTSCTAFQRVKVRITTEYCQCPQEGCVRPPTARVRLLSLVYFPDDCLCSTDVDCEAGTFCRKDALSPTADCWRQPGGCRGVCEP